MKALKEHIVMVLFMLLPKRVQEGRGGEGRGGKGKGGELNQPPQMDPPLILLF